MIKTFNDLKSYIKADYKRQNMQHPIIARFTWGEHDLTRRYLFNLRVYEYFLNNSHNLFMKSLSWLFGLKHRRNNLKYGMYIFPNTVGKGFLLPHPGFVRIPPYVKISDNCTILPMVLFGKKKPDVESPDIIVGDNCYISTGVTILGPVKIGHNVTIGAGAVITKDIPDNCVVGGVPAKVIKMKE